MKNNIYNSSSSLQTKKLAKELAKSFFKKKSNPLRSEARKALILCLNGELGAGKTCFLQGLAKGLGIKEKITSPTFVIMKKYQLPNYSIAQLNNFAYFYHFDCYRIKNKEELSILGFKEIVSNPENIIALEWSDRIYKKPPHNSITLKFKFINNNKREIRVCLG